MEDYVNVPIDSASVPEDVKARQSTDVYNCRYFEAISDEGFYVFDRATNQWSERVLKDG